MAHEIPIHVRPSNPPPTKTNKHKPVPQPLRQLPNGERPNFGPSSKEKPLKSKQQLPNGDKPNFGHESTKASKNTKKLKKKNGATNQAQANNGSAAHTNNNTQSNGGRSGNSKSAKKGEESYAGSSFHSSPEAMALPKPSFKSSPKAGPSSLQNQSPVQTNINSGSTNSNMHPAFVYQGMPPSKPPRYPVTAYPPSGSYHPGFNYNTNPQGFINYLYPPTAVPQPPIPMQSYPLGSPMQLYQQQHQYQPQNQPQAQKITFNELMGSSE